MTIPVLFEKFMRGAQLPNLATSTARALLDLARDKLLSRGIRATEPSDTGPAGVKRALLDAHKALTGTEVYASATSEPRLAGLTQAQVAAIMDTHRASGKPILELFAELHGGTRSKSAPASPAQLARIAELERKLAGMDAKLATLRAREAALVARKAAKSTATARTAKKTSDMLGRRAAAAAKPAAAAPPRPLADATPAHLSMLISHPSATAADRAAAIAEAALRPGVTIHSDGRTSVSSRGGRAVKATNRRS